MFKLLRYCHIAIALILASCGGDDNAGLPKPSQSQAPTRLDNVQPVRIDRPTIKRPDMPPVQAGSNRLLTSVTLCSDSTGTHCQTIDDIVVDTGSVGLKIYNYALLDGGTSLPDERDADNNRLAMCARYASGYAWGQMKVVTLKMAGETAENLPVAVINGSPSEAANATVDQNLLPVPDECSTIKGVEQRRKFSDSNGILGVGAPFSDCAECVKSTTYYACTSSAVCTPTFLPTRMQTTQPVASFSADNNGLVIKLPDVDKFSTSPIAGQMIFGIGTQPDNQPGTVNAFTLNESGRGLITVNGEVSSVLIDSGTFDYVIPGTLPVANNGWYAPPTPTAINAIFSSVDLTGIGLDNQQSVSFTLADPAPAFNANGVAINNLGRPPAPGNSLALLGLPFFFGKSIYLGLNGRTSILGTGPIVAF